MYRVSMFIYNACYLTVFSFLSVEQRKNIQITLLDSLVSTERRIIFSLEKNKKTFPSHQLLDRNIF